MMLKGELKMIKPKMTFLDLDSNNMETKFNYQNEIQTVGQVI